MRTMIRVDRGMEPYACRFGAKSEAGRWFVDGDVPLELRGLVINSDNSQAMQRLLAVYQDAARSATTTPAPRCPRCGKIMVARSTLRTGNDFWGCPGYPHCKGILEIDVHPRQESSVEQEKLAQAMATTVRFALQHFEKRANGWLSTPKVALKGKAPFAVMVTMEGCRSVYALIRKVAESN